MGDAQKFAMVVSGQVPEGLTKEQAVEVFIGIFNVAQDKAELFFQGEPRLLRRNLDSDQAQVYSRALNNAGIAYELKPQEKPRLETEADSGPAPEEPSATAAPTRIDLDALELVPQEGERAAADVITCPKCSAQQPPAQQCIECGIVFEKYRGHAQTAAPTERRARRSPRKEESDPETKTDTAASDAVAAVAGESSAGLAAVGVAAVVALVGAWVWQMIALSTGYEFGFVAWLLGGAVGLSAALMGGRGQTCAVVCAALALLAILGGKYLTIESFKEELVTSMAAEEMWGEEGVALYEELKLDAELYRGLDGSDESLRAFLAERNYSEASGANGVTQEEIDAFHEFDAEGLEWLAFGDPSYEEWQQYTTESIEEISSGELIMADFGILDLVFLVLGIATAFRLGGGFD